MRLLVKYPAPSIKTRPETYDTLEYSVNGTGIPDVNLDVGESYAGLIPISKSSNETRELYLWFFPSGNADGTDENLIWLNGGVSLYHLQSR